MADGSSSRRRCASWVALIMAALLACDGETAATQIKVDGSPDAVRVDVVDAPLHEILNLLQTRYGLRYRSQSTLGTERTVKLIAPLHQAVVRLLEGYDFVIAITSQGVDVLIVQQSASANDLIPRSGPPAAPAPLPTPSGEANRRERD
jgi:hypothetical protein